MHFMKSFRNINEQMNMLLGLMSIGIKSIDAWTIMIKEAGGNQNVGF